jgi:hypothetical protein
MVNVRIQMLCAAADVAAADALIGDLLGSPQAGTFGAGLSPTGAQPPTHFGSSGVYEPDHVAEVQTWVQGEPIYYAVCAGVDEAAPAFDAFAATHDLVRATPPPPPED